MQQARAPEPERPVLVLSGGDTPPDWAVRLRVGPSLDPTLPDGALSSDLEAADAILVNGAVEAPLSLVRRLRRLAPRLQPVLVVDPAQAKDLERAMLFTPGVGELWMVTPDELDQALIDRAAGVGRQRRAHARRAGKISAQVASLEAPRDRPILTDQFLATLLELLPEPTFALNSHDEIVFANPAARSTFEIGATDHGGAESFIGRVDPEDPELLSELLEEGRERVSRGQFTLHPNGSSPRVYDATVAPVTGDRPVRAVVLHDVTAAVEARRTLQRTLADLQRAMEHRTRFYASMSHELRTPINAIMGYNSLLLDEIYGGLPTEQRDALQRISIAAQHLLDLVNDVLDLSKIESGKIALEPASVVIRETIEGLAATMEPLAREHGTRIEFDVDRCTEPFLTDPRRLRQILLNLISNAIRYGGGQPVEVRCAPVGDSLRVEVSDRGPGIAPEKMEEIFDEFVQLRDAESDVDGTGLGLAIARALARALGGELTATSELGSGSTFAITIPPLHPTTLSG